MWAYKGSWDGCWEMLAMAHAFNKLPLLTGSSWPIAACMKCNVSPHMGQLAVGLHWLLYDAAMWTYMGSWDSCQEMLAMAHGPIGDRLTLAH